MKVLLIDSPGRAKGISTAFAHLSAIIKRERHDVFILDLNNKFQGLAAEMLEKTLNEYKPDLIGFTMLSLSYNSVMETINMTRKLYKNGTIIVGGAQTFIEKEQLLKDNKNIDIVVVGEGEQTLIELLQKKPSQEIDGIIYRDGKQIIINRDRQLIQDLDTIPFPDYKALGVKKFWNGGLNSYPILTSRGCPFGCSFCYASALSKRTWRARKPEELIKELKQAKKLFDYNGITILDDNFTLDVKRAEKFCDLIVKNKLQSPWNCMARADRLTDRLVKKMKAAGCEKVQIGVESLNPPVFKLVNKGESIQDIERATKLLKKHGIKVYSFFIIGLAEETYDGIMYTYKRAKEIGFDFNSFQNIMPLPCTTIYNWYQQHGTTLKNYKNHSQILEVGVETPEFSKEERIKAFEIISIKEKAYPFDSQKSNFENGLKTLWLILRYDIIHLPSHISKLLTKTFEVLFNKSRTLSSVEFEE